MFSNFFDGKSLKQYFSQNNKQSKFNIDIKQQNPFQKDYSKSPQNKSNISANVSTMQTQQVERKCTTPDNQTKKLINNYEQLIDKQNKQKQLFTDINKMKSNQNNQVKSNSNLQKVDPDKNQKSETQTKLNQFIINQKQSKYPNSNELLKQNSTPKLNINNAQNNLSQMKKQLNFIKNQKTSNSTNNLSNNNSNNLSNNNSNNLSNNNSNNNISNTGNIHDYPPPPNIHHIEELEEQQKLKNNKLIYYMKINDWEKCFQLLSKKSMLEAEVNCSDESCSTPLHFACQNNNLQLVTLLLAKEAKGDCQNISGMTPLMTAAQKGHEEVVEKLLKARVDPNLRDIYKNTALHYACLSNTRKTVEYLLAVPNIDITILNFENKPAFEMTRNKEILQLFNNYFILKKQQVNQKISDQKQTNNNNNNTINNNEQRQNSGGNLQKTIKNNVQEKQEGGGERVEEREKTSEFSQNILSMEERKGVSPVDFHVHGLLGKGSFGEVYLVEKKDTQDIFAMKALDKHRITKHNLINYAMTERNVLSTVNHPFIVKLNYAFQTIDKLFLILEFAPGGDLGDHLQKETKFNEKKTKMYVCEIILALEELHKKDIIFRDLKPENIVLDQDGHALLTDFGLSKEGVYDPNAGARSFCGSVAYLAPEMLKREGHGKAVDWYLLGVVMYEMLVGLPPYYADSKEQLFYNIENAQLKIPSSISDQAKSLLKALLQRNPLKRLGSGKGDSQEIKQHPFFQEVDWQKVLARKYQPPKVSHKIKINPKYNNKNVFSQPIDKHDQKYISGWSFICKD